MSARSRTRTGAGRTALRCLVVVLAISGAWHAAATTYLAMTPSQVLSAADVVFLGTVTDVTTETRSDQPWTVVTLRIDDLFAGYGYDPADLSLDEELADAPTWHDPEFQVPETVTLSFLGGETATGQVFVAGAPAWRLEEEYLVAAYLEDGLASPVVGFSQGAWRASDEGFIDHGGAALAVADDGAPVRSTVGAGRSQVLFAVRAVLSGGVAPTAGSGAATEPQQTEPDESEPVEAAPEEAAPPVPPSEEPSPEDAEAPGSPADEDGQQATPAEPTSSAPTPRPLEVWYDVVDAGGPLLLSESAARAAQAWRDAADGVVDLTLVRRPDATNVLRYGDESLFGPDTLSLTTVTGDGAVTVSLSPTAGELLPTVLLHALGVIIGLQEGGEGVMASAVSEPIAVPTPAEVEELLALSLYEPADLTRDGSVDFYDLLELAASYGQRGVNLAGDLDGDGVIDDADIERLRRSYRFERPQAPTTEDPPGPSGS